MDKKAHYELTAQRMTLCPVCFEEIAVKRLEKHLLKEHSRAKQICCISCSAPFKKSKYVQHIRYEHSDGFWIGTGVKKAQLNMVIQRWYSPVPDKNTLSQPVIQKLNPISSFSTRKRFMALII